MNKKIPKDQCPHSKEFDKNSAPSGKVCEVCGEAWETRLCLTCGFVGCCESSKGHDTGHWKKTGHPIIKRLPLGKDSFTWCYECKAYLE